MTAKPSRFFWTILLALLTACGGVTPLAKETPATTTIVSPISTPAPTKLPVATDSTPAAPVFTEINLSCETFMEFEWGTGTNQLGFKDENAPYYQKPGPDFPFFDEEGNMFMTDRVNERIMIYPKGERVPKVISLPEMYTSEFLPRTNRWWSGITISGDRIFFLVIGIKNQRQVLRLFALSIENNNLTTIDLEPYYSQTASEYRLFADMHGGVYFLQQNILVHYDKNLRPNIFASDELTNFLYLVRGRDGNLYTAGSPGVVKNWGPDAKFSESPEYILQNVQATLGAEEKGHILEFIGVDITGKLYFLHYFQLYDKPKDEIDIIRFDVRTRTGDIGKITNKNWIPFYFHYRIDQGGIPYSLIYNPEDTSVQPKIIKCPFQ